jgi:voltage-gated potassium channel
MELGRGWTAVSSPWRRGARWRRFVLGLSLLLGVLTFGTCGYVVIGLGPFDAVYQTAVTISTVGYGEIGPAAEVDRSYRTFTLVLVLVGASSAVYTASVLIETLVEGTIDDGLRRRRVQRQVSRMSGHVIVAGWGRVGRSIAAYAGRRGMAVVAVDADPAVATGDVPAVVGDATEDETLLAAGVERAASLIAALGGDSDNLALTLTARSLNADLMIVARVADQRHERKFRRAGADRVVNPYEIGGTRMAAIAFRPHVAEFLDEVVHTDDHDVDIDELVIAAASGAVGARLGDLVGVAPGGDGAGAAMVIAVKHGDGPYVFNPPVTWQLAAGDVLIAIGTTAQLTDLAAAAAPATAPAPAPAD